MHDDRGRRGEVRNAIGACLSVGCGGGWGGNARAEVGALVFAAELVVAVAGWQHRRGGGVDVGIIGSGWCRRMEV